LTPVRQAAEDWLAYGLAGRSAKTIKKNENVLEPLLQVIGGRKLRELTAGDVRQALSTMAAGYSSAVVAMGHLALKRTIRHAEANDLVARNVAALVDTPKGQEGRPSKALTVEQAAAVIEAAKALPAMELHPGLKDVRRPAVLMHAYIVLSLLAGLRTEEARAYAGTTSTLTEIRTRALLFRRIWPCGDRCVCTARPRPSGHGAHLLYPASRSRRSARCWKARQKNDC
jgi:integrase